jgi:hypothetical protein
MTFVVLWFVNWEYTTTLPWHVYEAKAPNICGGLVMLLILYARMHGVHK